MTGKGRVLVRGEQPPALESLRDQGVHRALVAVTRTVVEIRDVPVRDQQRDIAGDEPDALDLTDQTAVACPRREDDAVAVDDLFPAVLDHPVRDDVVRLGGEALGVGDRVAPTVEHVLVVIADRGLVGVANGGSHGKPFVS
ncbi:hypothetical protein SDC9_91757 [bioreactor metagenome]|uniref:Uncharacterized protein n=1 Tax=bioreactor metagenome TaxID=1076179 RepID=A0A644ZW56_9ZZZZ